MSTAYSQTKALVDAFIDLMEAGTLTERGTMEILLDILSEEQLAEMGHGHYVDAYRQECGA